MVGAFPHGFARYVSLMARGLGELDVETKLAYEPVFLLDRSKSDQIPKGTWGRFRTHSLRSAFLSPFELLEIPRALQQLGAQAYHSPSFSSLLRSPCPWAVTIHDLNHLQFGGKKERLYYRWILKPFARKARRLLTVSEFSRDEIASWLGSDARQIEVVPNALDPHWVLPVDEADVSRVLARIGLERGKYFICLSNSKPHKNVAALVEAHGRTRSPWPLVLSLRGYERVPGVHSLGPLGDDEARILVSQAGALVFPSLYEGFGLPPLEAAALGVPILVSRIPAHEEALRLLRPAEVTWVPARDVEAWASALTLATSGNRVRPGSDTRRKILETYSPRNLGAHMDAIYRDMLGL